LKPSIDKYDEVNFYKQRYFKPFKRIFKQEDIADSDKKFLNKKSKIQICGRR
jgi:hypothetical protein